jgi:hypothetical protein
MASGILSRKAKALQKRVMAALGAAIHGFLPDGAEGVDGRAEPGHDDVRAVGVSARDRRPSDRRLPARFV